MERLAFDPVIRADQVHIEVGRRALDVTGRRYRVSYTRRGHMLVNVDPLGT